MKIGVLCSRIRVEEKLLLEEMCGDSRYDDRTMGVVVLQGVTADKRLTHPPPIN